MNVLQVQHVKKIFGSKLVLDDINFTVNSERQSNSERAKKSSTHRKQFTRGS